MKLSQVYSDKPFNNVVFNEGLNIILAKVTRPLDVNEDSHNLGKSTLITLIDYLLLKAIDKNHLFSKYKLKFEYHTFFLEILLNNQTFLTIKRAISPNSKISFKHHVIGKQNFSKGEVAWDEENMPLKKGVAYLNSVLAFDILGKWHYRKTVSYFLRSQADYNDVFQLKKYSAGNHKDWKPLLFDLLGFNGDLLKNKYDEEENKKELADLIEKFKKQFQIDPDELDKIQGEIELKRGEQISLQKKIDEFNFYEEERELSRELIEDIESQISLLNTEEYDVEMEIDKIQLSFENNLAFDIEDIKSVYEDVEIFLPDNLLKSYSELIEFNEAITQERNKFLKERYTGLNSRLREVRKSLLELNVKRNEYLSYLKDRDTFNKFKTYQKELAKSEGSIVRLESQLESIDNIERLNSKIDDVNKEIKSTIEAIKKAIKKSNEIYSDIRKNFSNTIKYILNASSIIHLATNSNNNIEFKAEIQRNNITTAESEGTSYQKLLCVAFDLAILMTYRDNSFFRFVYHDGVFESLENRKKFNFIQKVRNICGDYDIQYILTAIEDHLPTSPTGQKIEFNDSQIAVILDDSGDEGKLFKISF